MPVRNPFDERRGEYQGTAPSDPGELTKQLGFIASYGQPDFRARGNEDTGIGDAVAGLFGDSAKNAQKELLSQELKQERALQRGVKIPGGKNTPRPKDVVQKWGQAAAEGRPFDLKALRSAAQAIMGAPYEMAIRQGNEATQDALADASIPEMEVSDELLALAAEDEGVARQLQRTMGSGRSERVEYQKRKIANEAFQNKKYLEELADPYSSAEAAEVYMRTGAESGVGEAVADHPSAKKLLASERARPVVLDMLPALTQIPPEQIPNAVFGDKVKNYYLPGQEFNSKGEPSNTPPSVGAAANALVNGGEFKDAKGRKFKFALSGKEMDALRGEMKKILLEGNEEDDTEIPDERLIALDYVFHGIDPGVRISQDALSKASRAYEYALREGKALHLQQTNGDARFDIGDEKLNDELYQSREIESGFWNGEETLAARAKMTPGEKKELLKVLQDVSTKKIGGLDTKIRREFEKDLVRRRYTNEAERETILNEAMPDVRASILSQNARKYAEKDFGRFMATAVMPSWQEFAKRKGLKDDSGFSKAGQEMIAEQDSRAEMEAIQQMMAMQDDFAMGGAGPEMQPNMENYPSWLQEELNLRAMQEGGMGPERFQYPGAQQLDGGQELGRVSSPQMVSNVRGRKAQRQARQAESRNPYGLNDALRAAGPGKIEEFGGRAIDEKNRVKNKADMRRNERSSKEPQLTAEQIRFLQTPGAMEELQRVIQEQLRGG